MKYIFDTKALYIRWHEKSFSCSFTPHYQFVQCQSYLRTEHDSNDEYDVDDEVGDQDDDDEVEVDDGDNLEDSVDPVGDNGGAGKVAFHLCRHTHQFVDLGICSVHYFVIYL